MARHLPAAARPMATRCASAVTGCGSTTTGITRCRREAMCILRVRGALFWRGGRSTCPQRNPKPLVVEEGDRVYLQLNIAAEVRTAATRLVDSELLGKAKIPGLGYENVDGSRPGIDSDDEHTSELQS